MKIGTGMTRNKQKRFSKGFMDIWELGKTPISSDHPAGEDVRFDPLFEDLQREMDKPSSLASSEASDWEKVLKLSTEILHGRAKDLLVLSYFCLAMLKKDGLQGLGLAMHIYRETVENFWKDLFPARPRARKNAVEWWIEKIDAAISVLPAERWQAEQKEQLLEDLKAVDAFLGENLDEAPILAPLFKRIGALIEVPAEKGEEAAAAPAAPASKPAAAASLPLPETFADGDEEKMLRTALGILSRVSSAAAARNATDALRFRLDRIVAWSTLEGLPPATNGRTLIPPPDEEVVRALKNLYASRNWADLLEAAESRVVQFLYWIDLSRYAAECLENLGQPVTAKIVSGETFLFVTRLSGVERLAFSDGTPFASPETRNWLKDFSPQGGAQGAVPHNEAEKLSGRIAKETATAREKAQAEGLPAALNFFREKLSQAPSIRECFHWKLGFCRLLHESKQPRLAGPYWRDLLSVIERYRLEEWDPGLAVEAFAEVLYGLRLAEEKDEKEMNGLIERVAALNPAKALEFL